MGIKIIRGLKMPQARSSNIRSTIILMEVGDAVKANSKTQSSYIRKVMLGLGFKCSQRKIGNDIYLWRTA